MPKCRVCEVSITENDEKCSNCGIMLTENNVLDDNFIKDNKDNETSEIDLKNSDGKNRKYITITIIATAVVLISVILTIILLNINNNNNSLIGKWITADGANVTITEDIIDIEGTKLNYEIYDTNILRINSDANNEIFFYWDYEIKDGVLFISMTLGEKTQTQTCTRV